MLSMRDKPCFTSSGNFHIPQKHQTKMLSRDIQRTGDLFRPQSLQQIEAKPAEINLSRPDR